MNSERLVSMANDIAAFFTAEPDRAAAVEGIANHLRKFWAPRMRTALLAYDADGGEGLHALVKAALIKIAPV